MTDKGHRFDVDEFRYARAPMFWSDAAKGDAHAAAHDLFDVMARPGFILVSLIPAGVQHLRHCVDLINPPDAHVYDIVSVWNAAITLINSILFYRILLFTVSIRSVAFLGAVVYSLLVNTNVYIRHLFPYDIALMFFLFVLLRVLRDGKQGTMRPRTAACCGILSAMGGLVYPGYYSLAPILGAVMAVSMRNRWRAAGIYGLFFFGTLEIVEVLSWQAEGSYIQDCFAVLSTVTHGSAAEGFFYMARYLKDVEGPVGVLLLAMFLMYAALFLRREAAPLKCLIGLVAGMYALHAMSGLLFHKPVFYGRSLHMYFPFLVLGAMRLLTFIPAGPKRRLLIGIVLASSVVSFSSFAMMYSRLSYPADMFFKYVGHVPAPKVLWTRPNVPIDPAMYRNYGAVLVNFESYWDVDPNAVEPLPPADMPLVVDLPHPLSFPAYAFENYSDQERALIRARHYRMRVYLAPQYVANAPGKALAGEYLVR